MRYYSLIACSFCSCGELELTMAFNCSCGFCDSCTGQMQLGEFDSNSPLATFKASTENNFGNSIERPEDNTRPCDLRLRTGEVSRHLYHSFSALLLCLCLCT